MPQADQDFVANSSSDDGTRLVREESAILELTGHSRRNQTHESLVPAVRRDVSMEDQTTVSFAIGSGRVEQESIGRWICIEAAECQIQRRPLADIERRAIRLSRIRRGVHESIPNVNAMCHGRITSPDGSSYGQA
jgi:hypothetical protein